MEYAPLLNSKRKDQYLWDLNSIQKKSVAPASGEGDNHMRGEHPEMALLLLSSLSLLAVTL
jgi:hypothetical protein